MQCTRQISNKILLLTTILAVHCFLFAVQCFSQTPNWIWARSAGQGSNGYSNSIAADASGNTYIAGYFYSDTLTFGSITLTNLDNTGNTSDMFLAKYDPNGNVLWAESAGGANSDGANSLALDASGNIYVTGWFYSPFITFGSVILPNSDNSGNTSDLFIAKYNTNGNVIWAERFGGTDDDVANSITVDVSNNIYLTGYFYNDTLIFGTSTLANGYDNDDVFLTKLDNSGNVIWANSAGGTDNSLANSVASDASGNAYVAGGFYCDTLAFGSYTLINDNGGYEDIFLAKYDSSGSVIWAKSEGGTNDDVAYSVAADVSGNAYLTGSFRSTYLTVGSYTLLNTDSTNGTDDIFLAKFNSNGNVLWAKSAGGTNDDDAYSVAVDKSGNSYIAGRFNSPVISFGPDTLTNAVSTGISADIFLAKYNTNGNAIWAKSAGGTDDDVVNSITLNTSNNIFVTGDFASTSCAFGNDNLLNDSNNYEIYVAKLDIGAGIKELNNSLVISDYPNPASYCLTVELKDSEIQNSVCFASGLELRIYDIVGNLILENKLNNYKTTFDVSYFPKGVYVVEVMTTKGVMVTKFLKE
jgi:hypothetical protein